MAKVKSKFIPNDNLTSAEHTEQLLKLFKRQVKREQILDYYKMHKHFMSAKEKREYKAKMNRKLK